MIFSSIAMNLIQSQSLMRALLGIRLIKKGEHCEYPKEILDCSMFVHPIFVVYSCCIHIAFVKVNVKP